MAPEPFDKAQNRLGNGAARPDPRDAAGHGVRQPRPPPFRYRCTGEETRRRLSSLTRQAGGGVLAVGRRLGSPTELKMAPEPFDKAQNRLENGAARFAAPSPTAPRPAETGVGPASKLRLLARSPEWPRPRAGAACRSSGRRS